MGIFDDVVVNAKSAAQTVGKMAGQFVDMSKLRINMAQDVSVRLQIKPGENVTALLIRLLERCLELSGKKD